ncbi:MAG: hypothetical protein K6A30_03870 [Lachnospiraceae bacterium]|nr:hypothetical protein [Lachnospiraceae bacterium]
MELQDLHKAIYIACKQEIDMEREVIVDEAKKMMPMFRELLDIISNRDNFDMTEEEYLELHQYYMALLQEILDGIEHHDSVALYDTLGYGMLEFVEMFLPEGEWERL